MDHQHCLPILSLLPYLFKTYLLEHPSLIPFITFFSIYYIMSLFEGTNDNQYATENNQIIEEKPTEKTNYPKDLTLWEKYFGTNKK